MEPTGEPRNSARPGVASDDGVGRHLLGIGADVGLGCRAQQLVGRHLLGIGADVGLGCRAQQLVGRHLLGIGAYLTLHYCFIPSGRTPVVHMESIFAGIYGNFCWCTSELLVFRRITTPKSNFCGHPVSLPRYTESVIKPQSRSKYVMAVVILPKS